jgi:DNA-binding winged helix-turn-helix (wHTH) protein/TolB-like protein/tetratricopeptide (TPR) repeat protein
MKAALYRFDRFRIDVGRRLVFDGDSPLPLTAKAYDLLVVLVERRGSVVDKDELLRLVWADAIVEEKNLAVTISALRKALRETAGEHRYIATVPGRGYQFVAPVTVDGEGEPPPAPPPVAEQEPIAPVPVPVPAASLSRRNWLAGGLGLASVVAAGSWVYAARIGRSPQLKAIAVLPFRTVNTAPGSEYLGVGLTDALIARLINLRKVVVRSTATVLQFAGVESAVEAGRKLLVDAVLEGNVFQFGERVRLSVQFIQVSTGSPLWASSFDERLTDLFAVEDSISQKVASALEVHLRGDEEAALTRSDTKNPEAHRLYMEGIYHRLKCTRDGTYRGIELFRQALAKDPKNARANAALAEAFILSSEYFAAPDEVLPQANEAAARALDADPRMATAHMAAGLVAWHYGWDWERATREFERAKELSPNDPFASDWYAHMLALLGKRSESDAEFRRARALDPVNLPLIVDHGLSFYYARDFDRSLEIQRKLVEMEPSFFPGPVELGRTNMALGRHTEALRYLEQGRRIENLSWVVALQARAHALSGNGDEARKLLAELAERGKSEYVSPVWLAFVHGALGEKDRAFELLEAGRRQRSPWITFLIDPMFDELRGDPRFDELTRKAGLKRA